MIAMSAKKVGRRQFLQLSALTATSVVLASCGATSTTGGAVATPKPGDVKRGGTLTLSLGPDFTTLDPYYDNENVEFKPQMFDSVLRRAPDGSKYLPWLAESWTDSADGKSLTLKLHSGVKWHNGRALTADDIVWSVQYAMDATIGHARSDDFATADSVAKVDDLTVQINYKSIDPSRYNALASLFVFPKENLNDVATKPIGTGPFKFQEWVSGDHLTIVKNPDYWREGEPYLDKLVVKPLPDDQSRMANLQSGAIDLLMGVPLAQVTSFKSNKAFGTYTEPPGALIYVVMINIKVAPFDNKLVRQAMMYCLNRDSIGKTAMHGVGTPALLPFPPSSWAYDDTLAHQYKYDINKAKDLLKQAGFPNGVKGQMKIRGTTGIYVDIAQAYQADLAKAGIQIDLLPMENAAYFNDLLASNFTMVMHQTGTTDLDPNGVYVQAACCRPFHNFMGITDNKDWFPQYEALVYQARDTVDQAQRKALYKQVLTIFEDEAWIIPIYFSQNTWAFKKELVGFLCDLAPFLWLNQAYLNT
jgi:peptide/nickel transport system substrate-binding protein